MGVEIELKRISLLKDQVEEWNLPHAPTKPGDTRSGKWKGVGQVELDAVSPQKLKAMCQEAIDDHFDKKLNQDLENRIERERPGIQRRIEKIRH